MPEKLECTQGCLKDLGSTEPQNNCSLTGKCDRLIWEQHLKLGAVLLILVAGERGPPWANLCLPLWPRTWTSLAFYEPDPQGLRCRTRLYTKEKLLGIKAKLSKTGKIEKDCPHRMREVDKARIFQNISSLKLTLHKHYIREGKSSV